VLQDIIYFMCVYTYVTLQLEITFVVWR